MITPQGSTIGPAGARNRRKATVKKNRNRPLRSVATKGTIPKKTACIISLRGIFRTRTRISFWKIMMFYSRIESWKEKKVFLLKKTVKITFKVVSSEKINTNKNNETAGFSLFRLLKISNDPVIYIF